MSVVELESLVYHFLVVLNARQSKDEILSDLFGRWMVQIMVS